MANANSKIPEVDTEDRVVIEIIISEGMIQSDAEANFGRELTDVELNRVREGYFDNDDVFFAINDIIRAAIEDALDDKNNAWGDIDKEFLETKTTKQS